MSRHASFDTRVSLTPRIGSVADPEPSKVGDSQLKTIAARWLRQPTSAADSGERRLPVESWLSRLPTSQASTSAEVIECLETLARICQETQPTLATAPRHADTVLGGDKPA